MPDAESKTYFITTPIYYVNGLPHVGSALTTVACDVLARYQHLRGRETWFLTGTDENATKVQEAAEKAGVPTQQFVDGLAEAFETCWKQLHVHYNDFIRTTEPRHVQGVQEFFARLRDRGYIYLDTYEGWYSVSDETFYRDSEVKDGFTIKTENAPSKPVVRTQEQNWFFKLSAFGDRLLAHIETHPGFLQPEFRRNEVIGFIKEGLRDMSITRPYRGWGIQVPDDPANCIYVWFDALINYLVAAGWPDDPTWPEKWPADLHFMGKEIFVRFHATLWPAMLMALDLPLPKQVYAHGWWTVQGEKGGKTGPSLPHPTRFTQLLADRSGASFEIASDALRYLLCREMNFGLDTEFTVENCLRRYNTDLANDLGNLLNRTLNMLVRYCDGVVPAVTAHDPEIAVLALEVQEETARAFGEFRLNGALESTWRLVARMNKYIDEKAPWTLAKAANNGDEAAREALHTVLYSCLEVVRIVSILVSPFLPVAADTLRAQIGLMEPAASARWEDLAWGGLPAGTHVNTPQPVFPRIQELAVDEATLYALGSSNPPAAAETSKENTPPVSETAPESTPPVGAPVAPVETTVETVAPITIDDFMKVQLLIGEILAAEPVPNATKLLRLAVQTGEDETRTILSGIAEYYKPEDLIGKQVVVVANLLPRKMRGIESQGMLLAADVDGKAVLVHPDAVVAPGSRVR